MGLILAAFTATYSRFVPSFKSRFDYGAMIFILTFSLVSVGGYRVDKLFDMAQQRASTIAIGTSICIVITVFLCPIWAGSQLNRLVQCNFVKLADSLDGKGRKKRKVVTQETALAIGANYHRNCRLCSRVLQEERRLNE